MAQVKCSDCGKEINEKVRTCPYCGAKNTKKVCLKCNKEISKKAKICPECGAKVKNNVVWILSFVINMIVTGVLLIFLLANASELGDAHILSNFESIIRTDMILNIVVVVLMLGQLFITYKFFRKGVHIVLKIIAIILVLVACGGIGYWNFTYWVAKKYDFNLSYKNLVEIGKFDLKDAKKIDKKIDELFERYTFDTQIYYVDDLGDNHYIFYVDDYEGYHELNVILDDCKLKDVWWDFNEDYDLYLYQDSKPTEMKDYYIKILSYAFASSELGTKSGYLESRIKEDIKEMLKAPSSANFEGFDKLYYDSDSNSFYYIIDVDSQNSFGTMVRTKFKVNLRDKVDTIDLDYDISVSY